MIKIRRIELAAICALFGAVVLIAGIIQSATSYNQLHPNPYSFTNHFVSELGWSKSSNKTALFNWGLVAANLAFLPMMIAIGRGIGTRLGYFAMFSGVCALIAGSCVGIWPIDHLKLHLLAAITFFSTYLVTIFLFTLAFCPRWNNKPSAAMLVVGTIGCLFAVAFLAYPKNSAIKALQHMSTFQRPDIWWLALLEWCVVASTLLWGFTAIMVMWRK